MIIGSGLVANAFAGRLPADQDVWIYAAGVSNSGCSNRFEFDRERARLSNALMAGSQADVFVYFSTCSVMDPKAVNSAYVGHKLEMEKLVSQHPNFLIVRLSQMAGKTPNPNTLLNYLYARISRSEIFVVWKNATRNIIDIDDVASIVIQILADTQARRATINVANPISYPITELIAMMEKLIGKPAITKAVGDGGSYNIDTSQIRPIICKLGLAFDDSYVFRVMQKYYG
jgi:nucleoside-diphosphate-sugar epimerase